MNYIMFTHANNKQEIYLVANQIAGFYYSPASACTHIVATGGAVFPALESVEIVKQRLETLDKPKGAVV